MRDRLAREKEILKSAGIQTTLQFKGGAEKKPFGNISLEAIRMQ